MQADLFDDDPFKDVWPHPWRKDNPSLDGLSDELKDIICDQTITAAMIRALYQVLRDKEPHVVEEVIRRLRSEVWWNPKWKHESAKRFVRRILDTGVARGIPFCSGNYGYCLGDAAMLLASRDRELAIARGATAKAEAFERCARRQKAA